MADTPQTPDQILTAFADTIQAGAITPEVMRQYIVSSELTVTAISDLQANKSVVNIITTLGYLHAGDGGGGTFVRRVGDTTTEDNGGTIIVDNAGTRWFRLFTGPADIRWFGANATLSDNTQAIQAAVNSGVSQLYVPVGTFRVDMASAPIQLVSNQSWLGAGKEVSIISFPQADAPGSTKVMFHQSDDLDDVSFAHIGFRGNLLSQTSAAGDGQSLWCFYLRNGSLQRITFDDVHIFQFGDQTKTGGGCIGLGSTTGSNTLLSDITIKNSLFEDTANVPGVYVAAANANTSTARNISVTGNTFRLSAVTGAGDFADQNMVFILGDTNIQLAGVSVVNNYFDIHGPMDTLIEIDYANSVIVNGVHGVVDVATDTGISGILLRGNINNWSVSNVALFNGSHGAADAVLTTLQFNAGEQIINGSVTNLSQVDWGAGIKLLGGTNGVVLSGISQLGSAIRLSQGFTVGDAKNVVVNAELLQHASYHAILAGTTAITTNGCIFNSPTMIDVGDGSTSLDSTGAIDQRVSNYKLLNPVIINPVAGTLYVSGPAFHASNGNVVITVPALIGSLIPVNPSYAAFVASNYQPAPTNNPVFTGVVTVPNGSAAAPSLTFAGNAQVGLSYVNTNTLGLVTTSVGAVSFVDNANLPNFQVSNQPSATGYLHMLAGVSAAPDPAVIVEGTGNANIKLTPLGTGLVKSTTGYSVNGTAGISVTGAPTSSFATVGGIVTVH